MRNLLIFILCCVYLSTSASPQRKIIVAQDGSGRFTTIQAAINWLPSINRKPIIIYVKNGVYVEKLRIDSGKNFVRLVGEDKYKTIITWSDHTGKILPSGEVINTRTSATITIKGNNFSAENLTIRNDAGFTAGQAVGLEIQGDRAVIKHCRIIGNQDVLFTNNDNSRQYFEQCYIEGTTDFIFGSSTTWFEGCHIHSKKNSHITAAATPQQHAYGYVFNNCILTADTGITKVSLGRPWRPYASVAYLHCYMGAHITPDGWSKWNNLETFADSRYLEYENFGPGANASKRVNWSRQLTLTEALAFTFREVLNWNPLM